ncbi:MAG: hypothetical protein HRU40_06800 [Saprospiraceae bacterium]|nr:hypothetical protein [Saprospiraceae bacterium]
MIDQIIPIHALPESARVWVYQSKEPLADSLVTEIRQHIQSFVRQWVSHNQALRAAGDLLLNRFVVLIVDESQAGASGCSIDSSVHFLKNLQANYGLDFFDRMYFTYEDQHGDMHTVSSADFAVAYRNGHINDRTYVFDTLVKTKQEFDQHFRKPLSESWHARMV